MSANYRIYQELKKQRDQVRRERRLSKKAMQHLTGEALGYAMGDVAFLGEQIETYDLEILKLENEIKEKS